MYTARSNSDKTRCKLFFNVRVFVHHAQQQSRIAAVRQRDTQKDNANI